jgi:hypothetical protein
MGRTKELFIEHHERLIGDYLDAHPEADEEEAYNATGGLAYDSLGDHMADIADHYYQQMKDAR